MKEVREEVYNLGDKFNLKMLLERSLVQLIPVKQYSSPSFEISIPQDKYIDSTIVNVTDELRELITKHFTKDYIVELMWNNTGSSFRVLLAPKAI